MDGDSGTSDMIVRRVNTLPETGNVLLHMAGVASSAVEGMRTSADGREAESSDADADYLDPGSQVSELA